MIKAEKEKWLKSKRFKANSFDTPLSSNGSEIAYNEIKKILENENNEYGSIYTSPYTRCVETALEFQKYLTSEKKIFVPIKIEPGLIPTTCGDIDTLYFEGTSKGVNIGDKKITMTKVQYIDSFITNEKIYARYGKKLFDIDYEPIMTIDEVNNENTMLNSINNRINVVKHILKNQKNITFHLFQHMEK